MQLLFLAIALATQLETPSVERGQWVEMERRPEVTSYIDVANIGGSGQRRTVWIRADYATVSSNTGNSRTFFLMDVDCGPRSMALARYVGFDRTGNQTNAQVIAPERRQARPTQPNTMGGRVTARICRTP